MEIMFIQGIVMEVQMGVQVPKANGGGSYPGSIITYRDENGKLAEQAFHENSFKYNGNLKLTLADLKAGEVFYMEKEKKGDFWNVTGLHKGPKPMGSGEAKAAPTTSTSAPVTDKPAGKVLGSNYETPEERARKQRYIVRQSSLTAALGIFTLNKEKATTEDIISVAKAFEKYVFEEDAIQGVLDLENDIPQ
jgi:hypothetical protein